MKRLAGMITARELSQVAGPGLAYQTERDLSGLRKHAGLERARDLEGPLGMDPQRVGGYPETAVTGESLQAGAGA